MKPAHQSVAEAFDKLEAASGDGDDGGVEVAGSEAVPVSGDGGDEVQSDSAGDLHGGPFGELAAALGDTHEPAATRTRDASGKFTKGEENQTKAPAPGPKAVTKAAPVVASNGTKAPKAAEPNATAAPTQAEPTVPGKYFVPTGRPPPNLKKDVAAEWATYPKKVQDEFERIHWAAKQGFEKNAESAKFHERLQQAEAPYRPMLGNADSVQAYSTMLQTFYVANHGTPQQKLGLADQILDGYGSLVDEGYVAKLIQRRGLNIEKLANALDGGTAAQSQHQAPQQFDQEQLFQQWEQRQNQRDEARRQQEALHRAHQQIEEFASQNDFLDSDTELGTRIRARMKALLGNQVVKDLKAAYDEACWADPESRSIIQQREASKAVTAQKASTQRAAAASTSIKSQPAPRSNGVAGRTSRESVEAAWDQLSSR